MQIVCVHMNVGGVGVGVGGSSSMLHCSDMIDGYLLEPLVV